MRVNKLSVIVPVYNEVKTLPVVFEMLRNLKLGGRKKEIIIVDDGSRDGSADWLKWVAKKRLKDFKFIWHKMNLGKGAAIESGLDLASGEMVVIQDADLEYNPKEIVKLVEKAEKEDLLVVYGTRDGRIKNKYLYPHYYWGSKLLAGLTRILFGQRVSDPETCYKLVQTSLMNFIDLKEKGFGVEMEISAKIIQLGLDVGEVPITYKPRSFAEGKKIRIKDGFEALGILGRIWVKDLHYGMIDKWLRWEREKRLDKHVRFNKRDVILDVGCGRQAHLGWRIMNRVNEYIGLDLKVPNVKIANLRLLKGDVSKIKNLNIRSVNKIVGLAILEHLENPERFVMDCREILKKSGELILTTPHPRSDLILRVMAKLGVIEEKEILDHKYYFDRSKLRKLFERSGYEVVVEEGFWLGLNSFVRAKVK